jgi:hypothetical protein
MLVLRQAATGRVPVFKLPPGNHWIQYATMRFPQRAGSDDIVLRWIWLPAGLN